MSFSRFHAFLNRLNQLKVSMTSPNSTEEGIVSAQAQTRTDETEINALLPTSKHVNVGWT